MHDQGSHCIVKSSYNNTVHAGVIKISCDSQGESTPRKSIAVTLFSASKSECATHNVIVVVKTSLSGFDVTAWLHATPCTSTTDV